MNVKLNVGYASSEQSSAKPINRFVTGPDIIHFLISIVHQNHFHNLGCQNVSSLFYCEGTGVSAYHPSKRHKL